MQGQAAYLSTYNMIKNKQSSQKLISQMEFWLA